MTRPERVIFTDELRLLNKQAERNGYNRQLAWEENLRDKVDPDGIHILVPIMVHNDDHLRCWLFLKIKDTEEPLRAMLDVSFESYDRMRTVEQFISLTEALADSREG